MNEQAVTLTLTDNVSMLRATEAGTKADGDWGIWRRAGAAGEGGAGPVERPMYWLYEMSHAALNPARAFADVTRLYLQESAQSAGRTRRSARSIAAAPKCSSARRAATASRTGASPRRWSAANACRSTSRRSGSGRSAGCCISSACSTRAAPAAAEAADRGADVRPLRDAAARHGRSLPAQPRRLHHRLGRCAHGAAVAKAASISTTTSTT